ncbi:MAG: alpha/beta fold hydrolase [Candidatus Rokubacteria bacterium]|nr:alpha/beta fold hydrolase [Candidatus Rokubacteria bacterium]
MRARYPDREGYVESQGVRICWEQYGEADRTVLFVPPWQIVHSRAWKMQVAYFARYFRVLTYDAPGNGRSGRSLTGYDEDTLAAHALAVLDASSTARASLVCWSRSTWHGMILAGEHPERVERLVLIGTPIGGGPLTRGATFHETRPASEGWEKFNAHYWRREYADFVRFFMDQFFTEPHSTKAIDDGVGWALETTPETLIATVEQAGCKTPMRELLARVRVPVLIIHGTKDGVRSPELSERLHEAIPGSRLVPFEGSGHAPHVRDPVRFNLLVRDFLEPAPAPRRTWSRAMTRPKRALFISSPIGLGHALRDVAIAKELRALHPDLDIQWLAQDPVTRVLEACGESVHPASRRLGSESAHVEAHAGEHDLRVFHAWRDMDEILLANFMTVHDVLETEPFDLVIGDEAWDVDYYLHENPELKRTAFAWLTDFVGWVPMEGPDSREAALTADYNAEMIEQIARFPRVRDRALFVGNADDVVDTTFGPGLPKIRDWTQAHYDFPGYILPFDPAEFADRDAVRARLGLRPDEPVVFAAVGGTGVGQHLLKKVVAAWPHARRLVPGLRMIVVAGPRIDPASLPQAPGLEYRRFVPDLYAHLAACDLAVVQGGLSTCMELTASKRPFLYFPLRNHFEQNVHVPHRLARYGAGTRMDYHQTDPETLAHAIADGLKRPVLYRDVETDGARRAAALIAQLV